MKLPLNQAIRLIVLIGLIQIAFEREALAYLDPGSASYALQMVIAGLVAVAFAVKTYWAKIKSFFAGGQSEKASDASRSSDASSS